MFRRRGQIKENEKWLYEEIILGVENDFNYLGCVFKYNGGFTLHQQYIHGKGLKALSVLMSSTICQLFDAFVGSVIQYNCEIWGSLNRKN